jgi:F-type H+-transporting ATPase subunit gamma
MVATARISKAQQRVERARPYTEEFTHVLTQAAKAAAVDHPLLVAREEPRRAGILVFTSDRGLAGGYNANAFREAERVQSRLREDGKEPVLFVIGRKGVSSFRFRGYEIAQSWTGFSEMPAYENAVEVADTLTASFLAGGEETVSRPDDAEDSDDSEGSEAPVSVPESAEGVSGVDELHIVYTEFENMLTQNVRSRQIAPLQLEEGEDGSEDADDEGASSQYEFEPEADQLFDVLLPKYLRTRVFSALLEAAASESAARRRAMKAATDNANDLIENLTREANQARQAQITQEISEIVGGANALAGSGE